MVLLIVVLSIFALIVICFLIPYSPMKNTFKKDIRSIKKENHIEETGAFRAEDFIDLPKPIQKYVESCG